MFLLLLLHKRLSEDHSPKLRGLSVDDITHYFDTETSKQWLNMKVRIVDTPVDTTGVS